MKAYLVTLGCPKNLVDSEATMSLLRGAGCEPASDPEDAQLLMVSACSFLDASWRETLDEVARLAAYKNGGGKRLVLMGCLPRHRQEDLEASLPEVDHFLPTGEHGQLPALIAAWRSEDAVARSIPVTSLDRFAGLHGRELLTPPHTAYVKVAEGCNRRCTFCAIPAIRGRQLCRSVADIVAEVEGLVGRGVREVTLLAQDIVSYAHEGRKIHDLVAGISATGVDWIRIFYVHPAGLDVGYLRRLLELPSVVPYLEMPVQHASNRILARMARSHDREAAVRLLQDARRAFPDIVIRSEVIVGFPGETDAEMEELKAFIEEFRFDSLGIFPYSPEPGTKAATLPDRVDPATVRDRVEELSSLQEAISFGARSRFVGRTLPVLVDRTADAEEADGARFAGRFHGQALEVDGEVYIEGDGIEVGSFVEVRITDAGPYDLAGIAVSN